MKEPYICQYCDQRSTRWWNLKIHMKRKHGDYSLDRSSGRYTPNNPFWYNNPYHKFGGTVADSVGNTFQHRYLEQGSTGISHYSPSPMYLPRHITDDLKYSEETKLKELKRLVYKYPQYCPNAGEIITWVSYSSANGDNRILDEKLEQLRTIDRRLNGWS
jgi:hypothetical protein